MRILSLLAACLSIAVFTPAQADVSLVQTYAITNVDASGNSYRAGGANADNAPVFQGANLGTAQTSVYLNGGEIQTTQTDGDTVTSAYLFFRLYRKGINPGAFIQIELPYSTTLAGTGNIKWSQTNASFNIAQNLDPGTYVLEVYWRIAYKSAVGTSGPPILDSNSGDYYQATLTIPGATLPVSLIDFSVNVIQRQVFADWSTASEHNNAHFDLERSSDARTFERIARLDGHGTTTARQAYSAIDESPRLGINYYRLRQTDADGTFSFSPMRSAIVRTNGEIVLPNQPANAVLTIDGLEESSQIDITTLQGRLLHRQKSSGSQIQIDVGSWPDGLYLLRIADQLGVQVQRVVVQH